MCIGGTARASLELLNFYPRCCNANSHYTTTRNLNTNEDDYQIAYEDDHEPVQSGSDWSTERSGDRSQRMVDAMRLVRHDDSFEE